MTTMGAIVTIIVSIIGFFFGCFVGLYNTRKFKDEKTIGTIRVDKSDPDSPPFLFLELYSGQSHKLYCSKQVLLDVSLESYIPQK